MSYTTTSFLVCTVFVHFKSLQLICRTDADKIQLQLSVRPVFLTVPLSIDLDCTVIGQVRHHKGEMSVESENHLSTRIDDTMNTTATSTGVGNISTTPLIILMLAGDCQSRMIAITGLALLATTPIQAAQMPTTSQLAQIINTQYVTSLPIQHKFTQPKNRTELA